MSARDDCPPARQLRQVECVLLVALVVSACEGMAPPTQSRSETPPSLTPVAPWPTTSSSAPTREEGRGEVPVIRGEPIDPGSLAGRIVFDDFEDVYTMNADGSDLRVVADEPGPEFDGAWSPDGEFIAYRDSRRGINEDDEIYVVAADGSGARNLSQNPANDWGPDWSPDGRWIVFNSDRDGSQLRGYLADITGTEVRTIQADAWVEYPSFSPDGSQLVFMGHEGSDYDIFIVELETGRTTQLTDATGSDGWPVWSPDGASIAFASERDDCARSQPGEDCWRTGEPGEHHDIWLMDIDGANQRRVTPEFGQFVAWSPDSRHLLVSGHTLFVVRPDGTGRTEIRPPGLTHAPGGIPDWIP